MSKSNFSELFTLVRNNPVGFLKFYFRSNMNVEEIGSWDPDRNEEDKNLRLDLDLYDGINFIGSFSFAWSDIEEIIFETEDERGSVYSISGMKEGLGSDSKLGIRLDFPIPTNGAFGECYIYEYYEKEEEEEDEEEDEIKKTEIQKSIFFINQDEDEAKKMKQKRKRIIIFLLIGIILFGTWYFLSKTYPEAIDCIINFFR